MRKHGTLAGAAALVLLANAFALLHAARNRSGVEATLTLTNRELQYYPDPDDSGVVVSLRWVDPANFRYSASLKPEELEPGEYLDRAKLEELGFDTSFDPGNPKAYEFYNRQAARSGFVALEYEGDAWERWMEKNERIAAAERASNAGHGPPQSWPNFERNTASRLVLIDAARDPATLRSRYPDRSRVVILPAVIRITLVTVAGPGRPAYLKGFVQEVPSEIHIPRPFSDLFRARRESIWSQASVGIIYKARLKFGAHLEPWVDSVEFTN